LPLLDKILPEALLTSTSGLFSLGLFWLAFTFIYLVMPNTRVHFLSALIGGLVGASLWELAQMLLAWLHAQASFYNAIYGVVYHLLFFTLWMYWSWLIVLFGTEVTHAHQNLQRLSDRWRRPGAGRDMVDEYVTLAALVAISDRFLRRQPPLTLVELEQRLGNGDLYASRVVNILKDMGLVLEVSPAPQDGPPRYVPAMPLEQLTVGKVLKDLRQARMGTVMQGLAAEPGLANLLRHLAEERGASPWDGLSLKELVHQAASPTATGG
jgi:membrane protein